jgi:hypothetical protein
VAGGVLMLTCMFLGLGDIEFDIGDGMLYLKLKSSVKFQFPGPKLMNNQTFYAPTAPVQRPFAPIA